MSESSNPTRRDVMKAAGAVTAAAAVAKLEGPPAIVKVHAASDQMKYGMIGAGGRGSYLLKHLTKVDNGHCAAVCDLDDERLDKAAATVGTTAAFARLASARASSAACFFAATAASSASRR